MAPPPLAVVVMPFVFESGSNAIARECPKAFAQTVVMFFCPLAAQKRDDLTSPIDEFGPIAPLGNRCVRLSDTLRITRIPCVFGNLNLLPCGLLSKWRQRRT
jgi:hypothetical protein